MVYTKLGENGIGRYPNEEDLRFCKSTRVEPRKYTYSSRPLHNRARRRGLFLFPRDVNSVNN